MTIIKKELGKSPAALNETLWSILKDHTKCRSPDEERKRLFEKAKPFALPTDYFAQQVWRAFRACLSLVKHIGVCNPRLVDAGHTDLNAVYDSCRQDLAVNYRWLVFNKIHEQLEYNRWRAHKSGKTRRGASEIFFCDHIICELCYTVVQEIMLRKNMKGPEFTKNARAMDNTLSDKIREMPRAITVKTTDTRGELRVSWKNGLPLIETQHLEGEAYHVTLHTTTCGFSTDSLLSDASRFSCK